MTREEAKREIDFLDYYLQNHTDDYGEESHTAMMMAMDALEQEPCGDLISRQSVLDLIADYDLSMRQVVRGIHALSPVKHQKRTGHWITEDRLYPKCDQCGWEYSSSMTKFCPNCGAKMESEE